MQAASVSEPLCHPRFRGWLSGEFLPDLESMANSVVGLWPDLTIAYVNSGWFRFAAENGGGGDFGERWPLGRSIAEAIPAVVRSHYVDGYARCLREGQPWHHDYECSSAEEYRVFRMTAYPLEGGQGLLVVHSLVKSESHDPGLRPAVSPGPGTLAMDGGLPTQCAYCRRFRGSASADATQWLWVPDWVRQPPENVSHGICPGCATHYFGGLDGEGTATHG